MKAPTVCHVLGCLTISCEEHPSPRRPSRRPSSHSRGYGAGWRRKRALFLARFPVCANCGEPATDVDHILPRRQGGSEHESNLQALCHSCHSVKTSRGS